MTSLRGILIAAVLAGATALLASITGIPGIPVNQSAYAATPPDSCFAFNAGTGTITDYYNNEGNNPANPACTREVDIPSTIGGTPVTVIGSSAFVWNQLTSVTIPSSVTSIGSSAFHGNQLTSVTIPSSVTSIGNSAFSYNQLTSVTIPSSVTSIGTQAFTWNQLTSVTIPSSVTSIGTQAFAFNQLTSVTIANAATTMQHSTFANNPITTMTIGTTTYTEQSPTTDLACFATTGSTVTDYYQASPLIARDNSVLCGRDVTIPSSVTSIGSSAFQDNQLTSVTIPSSVTSIGNGAFYNNQLTSVTIPNSVSDLGTSVFSLNNLSEVVIPNSITDIPTSAFSHNQLTSVTIPSSVTYIQMAAFDDNQITSVSIPNSVTGIGSIAFANNQLTSVTIPSSVMDIGTRAFSSNQLTSVTIPSSVTSIGNSAFSDNQLTTVTIPSSVTSIGNYAFRSNQLTTVTIPSSVTSIGNGAFQANSIREVTIPSSVTSLGEQAFGLQTPQGRAYDRFNVDDDPASVAMHNQTVSEFFYTRLYTEDPSNPNNLQSEVVFYETELDGLDGDWDEIAVVGGHIVNPASAELSYVNQANTNLTATQTFTGQLPDDTYLTNYNVSQGPTIPMPVNGWSPTPQEIADALAALDAYYRIGDTVTIDPPAISGYITPESQTFVLGAADNTFSYVYEAVAGGSGTDNSNSAGEDELANTGMSTVTTVAAAGILVLAGIVSLYRQTTKKMRYRR